MRIVAGIIGCGLIGKKRYKYLKDKSTVRAVCDFDILKAQEIAKNNKKIKVFDDWKKIINSDEINTIFICTTHNFLSKILVEAIKKNKHVLVEKPASISENELKKAISISMKKKIVIKVGYNHRHHESIKESLKLVKKNKIGNLMFIKTSYGHGGRIGYEKEWRMNKKISGGGELLDQGSHLIDLSMMFLGKVISHKSKLTTNFWKTDVDDNAFLILEFNDQKVSFIHASCTEWKNNFTFEIYGKSGKIKIEGKGGSYGFEKVTLFKMMKKMGKPKVTKIKISKTEQSWRTETDIFFNDIIKKKYSNTELIRSLEILKLINKIYRNNKYDYI